MRFIQHAIVLLLLSAGSCLANVNMTSAVPPSVITQSLENLLAFQCKDVTGVGYDVYFRADEGEADAEDASEALRDSHRGSTGVQDGSCQDVTQAMQKAVKDNPHGIMPSVANAARERLESQEKREAGLNWEFYPEKNRHVFVRSSLTSGTVSNLSAQTLISVGVAIVAWAAINNPYIVPFIVFFSDTSLRLYVHSTWCNKSRNLASHSADHSCRHGRQACS